MFIDGALRNSESLILVTNPATGARVGSVSSDSRADVERAIASVASYDRGLAAEDRSRILRSAATSLQRRQEEFARLITEESGACIKESRKEVARSYANLLVAAEEAVRIHGEALQITANAENKMALTVHEPVGVVCAITPFNRPLNQVVVKVAPAIAANNSVIVKPSEKAPLTAILFASLLIECGLPKQMIALVTGEPARVGDALLASQAINMVTFTGSVETGQRIMEKIGLRKVIMELGGNDPLIVLADAPLDRAAAIATAGAFAMAGQSCRGIKRILAVRSIADELAERIVEQAKRIRLGDIFDSQTDIGTLINEDAAKLVERRCVDAIAAGAKLCYGGQRHGAAMTPTVLDHVPPSCELVERETFGPVAPIIRLDSLEEAIEISNSTRYGLQAGIMTRNFENFMTVAKRLRVGAVNLSEGPQFDSPHIPFGGVKCSGIGREGIRYSIREMTTVKTIVVPW